MDLEKFSQRQPAAQAEAGAGAKKRKQMLSELQKYMRADAPFSVKYKKQPMPYREKKGLWFEVRLSDASGELTARYWGGADDTKTNKIYESFSNGDVVWVTGTARDADGRMEISIDEKVGDSVRKCLPDEYSIDDLVPSLSGDEVNKYVSELNRIIHTAKSMEIQKVLQCFFADPSFLEQFKWCPGAISYHHGYRGGLIEHTLHVAKICQSVCEIYPGLDRDLTIAGALLHDIGKTVEYTVGTNIRESEEGMLRGHVVIGEEMFRSRCRDVDPKIRLKLSHIILSHHGTTEYGSPKVPQFPEAAVIYFADHCDAVTDQMLGIKEKARTEDAWIWSKNLERNIYLK